LEDLMEHDAVEEATEADAQQDRGGEQPSNGRRLSLNGPGRRRRRDPS
jgi:hypothetical protein